MSKAAGSKPLPQLAVARPAGKTAAERAFEERHSERRRGELLRSVSKPHKTKVAEFNERLAKLSEHYDIPKVCAAPRPLNSPLGWSGLRGRRRRPWRMCAIVISVSKEEARLLIGPL